MNAPITEPRTEVKNQRIIDAGKRAERHALKVIEIQRFRNGDTDPTAAIEFAKAVMRAGGEQMASVSPENQDIMPDIDRIMGIVGFGAGLRDPFETTDFNIDDVLQYAERQPGYSSPREERTPEETNAVIIGIIIREALIKRLLPSFNSVENYLPHAHKKIFNEFRMAVENNTDSSQAMLLAIHKGLAAEDKVFARGLDMSLAKGAVALPGISQRAEEYLKDDMQKLIETFVHAEVDPEDLRDAFKILEEAGKITPPDGKLNEAKVAKNLADIISGLPGHEGIFFQIVKPALEKRIAERQARKAQEEDSLATVKKQLSETRS